MEPKSFNRPIFIDVDNTLVRPATEEEKEKATVYIQSKADKQEQEYVVHKKHIWYAINAYHRGKQIFVWSGNGAEWAKTVCEALHIENYVTAYMTKPEYCVDDFHPKAWLKCFYIPKGWSDFNSYLNEIKLEEGEE